MVSKKLEASEKQEEMERKIAEAEEETKEALAKGEMPKTFESLMKKSRRRTTPLLTTK